MFICGSGSFVDEDEASNSPCPTPKRSKRNTSFCKIIGRDSSNMKNPYANRGLDKFYALLADLDDKKQKIYTQMGSEDISFVRFVYTNDSNNVKPIVVKVKKQEKAVNNNSSNSNQSTATYKIVSTNQIAAADVTVSKEEKMTKKKRCLRCNSSFKLENLKQPSCYFPVVVVMILLFLLIYGRSFAILCTSIGWYMMPSVVGVGSSSSTQRKPKRKKEYVRRQSDKKIVDTEEPGSPKSVINGL